MSRAALIVHHEREAAHALARELVAWCEDELIPHALAEE